MTSASKLRTLSRFLGVLALVIALGRLCFAVVKHTPIPWGAVLASVVICALVWMVPEAGASTGDAGSVRRQV
jgi:hypothetical protein